jgi:hypothetical protein
MDKHTMLQLATKHGADIGTWDKSGNGVKLVSFKIEELEAFTQAALSQQEATREPVGYISEMNTVVFYGNQSNKPLDIAPAGTKLYTEAIPNKDAECVWSNHGDEYMPDTYEGSCGIVWTFTEGTRNDNECNFCPRCGGKIVEAMGVSNG